MTSCSPACSGAARVQSQGGQLLSPDQTHLLLVTVPRTSALDTDASAALLARVEGEGARLPAGPGGPARLRAVGGPRFAAESAATVKHDVAVTMLTSVGFLVAIFVVRFRSLRLLAVAFVTLAFGIVGGLVAGGAGPRPDPRPDLRFRVGADRDRDRLPDVSAQRRLGPGRGSPPENVRGTGAELALAVARLHHHPDGVRPDALLEVPRPA